MPGIEDQPRGDTPPQRLFLQIPNRVLCLDALPSRIPHHFPCHGTEAPQLYSHEEPLPDQTGQCLRLRAPDQHTRLTWAPAFLSERGAP
jgi:hypothetical protein